MGKSVEQLRGQSERISKGNAHSRSLRLMFFFPYIYKMDVYPKPYAFGRSQMMPIRAGELCKCPHQASCAYGGGGVPPLNSLPMSSEICEPQRVHGPWAERLSPEP